MSIKHTNVLILCSHFDNQWHETVPVYCGWHITPGN